MLERNQNAWLVHLFRPSFSFDFLHTKMKQFNCIPAKLLFLFLLAQIRIILINLTRERVSYSFIHFLSPTKSNFHMMAKNKMFWSVAVVDNQQFANKESKVESSCSSLLVTHGIIGLARGRGIERGQRPHKETDGYYILFFNT